MREMSEKNERGRDPDWQTRASRLFCLLVLFLGVWLTVRYVRAVLAVFLIAWAVAALIDPLARKTEEKLKLPRKLCAALYLILLLVLTGLLIVLALNRLAKELEELMIWAGENEQWIGEKVGEVLAYVSELPDRLPFLKHAADSSGLADQMSSVDTMVSGLLDETVSGLGTVITTWLGGILRAAPEALITVVVTIMACFYLSLDYRGIRDRLIGLLPESAASRAHRFRRKAAIAIRSYIRAYLLLLLLTFCEVFVGLLILGQRYAFLLALLVAIVDILPILGAGTVLVPWAIVMLLLKDYSFGFGLLILYGVVTIVRQIAEPHIVGGSLGIHPLLSLFSMFLGLKLFGIVGMILGPAAALIVKELVTDS